MLNIAKLLHIFNVDIFWPVTKRNSAFPHLMFLNANVISDKQIVQYVGSNFQDNKKHVNVKMVT